MLEGKFWYPLRIHRVHHELDRRGEAEEWPADLIVWDRLFGDFADEFGACPAPSACRRRFTGHSISRSANGIACSNDGRKRWRAARGLRRVGGH